MTKKKNKSLQKNALGIASGIILTLIILLAIFGPFIMKTSPTEVYAENRLQPPSLEHLFGTDHFGRDIFNRIIYGARISLIVGFSAAVITTIVGTTLGLVAGYFKKVDNILMRMIDGMMAFPAILLAIMLVAALGGNLQNIVIALVFAYIPIMVRIVRSSTLQLKNMQYVEAAKASGTSNTTILFNHLLPNAITPIIVQGTFIFAEAILAEAALSFLGVGVQPPIPSWGSILGESRIYLMNAPWYSIFPGVAIAITVLSLNILGDLFRDLLDPHSLNSSKKKRWSVKMTETIGNIQMKKSVNKGVEK
ncbi:ABC transporter permease [Alteribacillus sp. YIM 98480]|uniref:ABC transporter permease n=1 Tax=Alteribacillus sp. YIM 98480 TaxID=2606599 RepID=UPI00131DDFB9|nr:ABC transporter permease [Alteribacillus sp. YIM 98480]